MSLRTHFGRDYRLFVGLTLAGYAVMALWPTFMTILGVGHGGFWFLDINTLLASNDAVTRGLDPYQPNPLDVLRDVHSYSAWWLQLRHLGLGRDDRVWLGVVINALFFIAVFSRLRPTTFKESILLWLILWSPPLILGFNRANPDWIIYATLVPVSRLLLSPRWSMRTLGMGLVALGIGMKYYPVLAGALLLITATSRRDLARQVALWMLMGAGLAFTLWDDLHRNVTHPAVINQYYTFGAATLPANTRVWPLLYLPGAALALLALFSGWHRPWFEERPGQRREYADFFLGSCLLVACFFLTINYAYRLVFILLMIPWLLVLLRSGVPRERRYSQATLALTLALLWMDGLGVMTEWRLHDHLTGEVLLLLHQKLIIAIHAAAWLWVGVVLAGLGSIARGLQARWLSGATNHTRPISPG